MPLRDTVIAGNEIVTSRKVIKERFTLVLSGSADYSRNRTIIDSKWVCLTESAATDYVDTNAGDTNTTYKAVQTNLILDAWEVQKHVDSRSAWLQDT